MKDILMDFFLSMLLVSMTLCFLGLVLYVLLHIFGFGPYLRSQLDYLNHLDDYSIESEDPTAVDEMFNIEVGWEHVDDWKMSDSKINDEVV